MNRKIHILCVEDDKDYLKFLKIFIRHNVEDDVEVDAATTVDDAIGKLTARHYDACFLDFVLGEKTGLDVLTAISGKRPGTAFIFLTAHEKKNWAFEAMRLGATDYLVKAKFDRFEFEKTLAYALYRSRCEIDLKRLATRDPLTGLGNRLLFQEQLTMSIRQAKREKSRLGVVYVDIDGFKPVNDTYGHDVGDEVLKKIGSRITGRIRDSDVAARLGGDEFAALLVKVESQAIAQDLARSIALSIAGEPYVVGDVEVRVGASIGVAIYPDDSEDERDLIRLADKRMFEEKRGGKKHSQMIW